MLTITGIGVSDGVCMGKLFVYRQEIFQIRREVTEDSSTEIQRFEQARLVAMTELDALYLQALDAVGKSQAEIFQIHRMMLEDAEYRDAVMDGIAQRRISAEYAVELTGEELAQRFYVMEDAYMRARAADVQDFSRRMLRLLTQGAPVLIQPGEPVILAAEDLAPSETVQMDRNNILGFVTRCGAINSHTAILARTMGLPAVVGVGDALDAALHGCAAILDGFAGKLYIDPDEETHAILAEKQQRELRRRARLVRLRGKENRTLDGRTIHLCANISGIADADAALENDAGGVGLFRSEFLYLESSDYPSEDTQYRIYRAVLEKMAGRRVVIRTADLGADKQTAYFQLPHEENPALGVRGVRVSLERPQLLITQLRALYRASAHGKLGILFPMITSVKEVWELKAIAARVRGELAAEGLAFSETVELGVMIETPAAALTSAALAREVDFFSVGTNDLIQYTLAMDRQNAAVARFCDPHHPAVLELIRLSAENAHRAGIWIGICGELAGDRALTIRFLQMGIDELSVAPGRLLELREEIRGLRVTEEETPG